MLFVLLACTDIDGAAPNPRPRPQGRDSTGWNDLVAAIEDHLAEDSVPGISVAVVLDGELAYAEGFGTTTYGGDVPVHGDTLFRWASISKMHTAGAAMRFVERGELSLDDPVMDTLPWLRLNGEPAEEDLTIRMLMDHTAGLPDELGWACKTEDAALVDYYQGWRGPLWTPGGAFYNYSNTDYHLLGAVIEALAGEPFVDVVKHEALEPLGMSTATFDAEEAMALDHAVGHTFEDPDVLSLEYLPYDCARSRPSAFLNASAEDMGRSLEAFLQGGDGWIGPDSVSAMRSSVDTGLRADGSHRAGFGQFSVPWMGLDLVTHDGLALGFHAQWTIVPEYGFGIAIAANAEWAKPGALRDDALVSFLGANPKPPPYVPTLTDPSTWTPYVATYEQPYDRGPAHAKGTLEVTLDGDVLRGSFLDSGWEVVFTQADGKAFTYVAEGRTWSVRFDVGPDGDRFILNRYWVGHGP